MKTRKIYIIGLLTISSLKVVAQDHFPVIWFPNSFPYDYSFDKRYIKETSFDYKDIEGSPYLNSEFTTGTFYMKDTLSFKLPIRYNICADQMEYQSEGVIYVVGSPQSLSRIVLGGSVFIYLPFIGKGGYFELVESGKCKLVQKMRVDFKPSEGSKPIVGLTKSRFDKYPDVFYLVLNQNQSFRIGNMNSVMNALSDQKIKIETFIKREKIKNTKKENLIKIAKYYNSL